MGSNIHESSGRGAEAHADTFARELETCASDFFRLQKLGMLKTLLSFPMVEAFIL